MARKPKAVWIAYRFADPMGSPRIKQDEDLVRLLLYLVEKEKPMVFGPSIHYVPAGADKRIAAQPIGVWQGGLKIQLFEGIEAPPTPHVVFTRATEFIDEGNDHGKEETEVRNDGSGTRFDGDQTNSVRTSGRVEELDDSNEAESQTELDGRGVREGNRNRNALQHPGDS